MKSLPLPPNQLLESLPPAVLDLLRPHLRVVTLGHEDILVKAGDAQSLVYFPHSGIISLVVSLSDGEMVEVGMIGRDSVFGVSTLYSPGISMIDAIVQAPGVASVIDPAHLRNAAKHSALFRDVLVRHEQALLAQAQQYAACNAYHTVEARLSRWLLRAHDLFSDESLPLTQGFLAQMIGVRRNSVSIVANTWQSAGLVRYRRGNIEITDLAGLRRAVCECYETLKLRCDGLLSPGFDHPVGREEPLERRPLAGPIVINKSQRSSQ